MKILTPNSEIVRTSLPAWRHEMKSAIRSIDELFARLELPRQRMSDDDQLPGRELNVSAGFSVFAPESYLRRIEKGNPADPLLLQILPAPSETVQVPGYVADPVGDQAAMHASGLIQKYQGRALVVVTGACGIHCRYCFRQNFPYQSAAIHPQAWNAMLADLANDASISEVILSGGDPWTITDQRLSAIVDDLERVPHVRRLRVHTRMPIAIPARVTDELCDRLSRSRLRSFLVVHANHPREIDEAVVDACTRLASTGAQLLNQSVLLKRVNDDVETLVELSERLLDARVLPYYLHQLDQVHGAARFEVPVERGTALIRGMQARLPGYAVPKYVREIPGADSKTPLPIA